MTRDDAVAQLSAHLPVLRERFGVRRLRLFGSVARNAAREGSDVDVLVDFGEPATPEALFGTQFYLEDVLGCEVDLVTERALRPQFRPYVERDVAHAYLSIEPETVWLIITQHLPALRQHLTALGTGAGDPASP